MTEEVDSLYQAAVDEVRKGKTASISKIQRVLKIGYNRAARLMEAMEEAGVILPMNEKGMRKVSEWEKIDPKTPIDEVITKALASKKKAAPKKKASKKKTPSKKPTQNPVKKKAAAPKKKATKNASKKKSISSKKAVDAHKKDAKSVLQFKTDTTKTVSPKRKSTVKKNPNIDEFGLNIKEREFADIYRGGADAVRGNAKRCYMQINPKAKESTAEVEGSKLLRLPKISEYLKVKSQEITDACDVNAKWLLDRLIEEADADLADLYYDTGAMKPIREWPMAWRRGLVSGVEVQQQFIYDDGEKIPDGYIVKIKQPDRTKIKEMIGKHVDIQAFKEKIEITEKTGRADRMSRARSRN